MNRFSYYITTHFIPSNKDYNSCHNSYSVYQTYPKRKGNKPAHLLAKHTSGVDVFMTSIEETPCFIKQAFLDDVTNASIQ